MSKRAKFIAILLSQDGVIEGANNDVIYNNHNHQAWCGSFQKWGAKKAKYKIFDSTNTVAGANSYKAAGKWHDAETAKPEPGWSIFMGFDPRNKKAIQHVETVVKDNGDGTVLACGGNTSSHKKGSQANGGQVAVNVRAYKKKNGKKLKLSQPVFIIGFGQNDEQGE